MAVTLAFLEGISILASMCAANFAWHATTGIGQVGMAAVLGRAAVVLLCFLIAFYYNDLYNLKWVRSLEEFVPRLLQSFAAASILLAILYLPFSGVKMAGGTLVMGTLLSAALVWFIRTLFYKFLRHPRLARRTLILGAEMLAQKLIEEIETQPHLRLAIVGVVDDIRPSEGCFLRYPCLGPLRDLSKIIEKTRPDKIIVAMTDWRRLPVRDLPESLLVRGIDIEDGVELYERLTAKIAIEWLTPSGLVFSRGFRRSRLHLAIARVLSVLAAVIGLILLAPLFGLVALAIKLNSEGPVFFIQERLGMEGKPFSLIKFRTMRPASNLEPNWLRDNSDPITLDRVTRAGKWLRRFRLDELPQLINILKGDMNLVGPRPHRISKFELFALVLRMRRKTEIRSLTTHSAPWCGLG